MTRMRLMCLTSASGFLRRSETKGRRRGALAPQRLFALGRGAWFLAFVMKQARSMAGTKRLASHLLGEALTDAAMLLSGLIKKD